MNTSLYHYLATSHALPASMIRSVKRAFQGFYLPLPVFISKPLLLGFLAIRSIYYFLSRVFVCEPLFKAYCSKIGSHFHTSTKLHWVNGSGNIEIGDHVLISGRCSFSFAARFSHHPVIIIGDHCDIGHDCRFFIGKKITLGKRVMIGQSVNIRDTNGHPVDFEARRQNLPFSPDDVKPVVVEDDVWIGTGSSIGPGITIGVGSVIAAHSVVYSSVPPYSIMGGNPARKMGTTKH